MLIGLLTAIIVRRRIKNLIIRGRCFKKSILLESERASTRISVFPKGIMSFNFFFVQSKNEIRHIKEQLTGKIALVAK